ncbi:MAG: hypothetical protein WCO11_11145 [Sphingomonadales bacterium]
MSRNQVINRGIGRREAMATLVGGAVVAAGAARAAVKPAAQPETKPIVLYCDLKVDPAREAEMLEHFHKRFKPAGAKFKGFIDLKMLKLRTLIQGDKLPPGVNYRFQLTYENEELRQIWIASKVHADLWPGIENTLIDRNFHVSLFDEV